MNSIEAFVLGIIQGLTEFLPVSSSGHLKLFQHLLGFKNLDQYMLFDVICHLGTLIAIIIYFRHPIWKIVTGDTVKLLQIMLATLPLFPLALLLKPIKSLYNAPQYLGFFFLLTAIILYVGITFSKVVPQQNRSRWKGPFIIGLSQALAILPGVSRSGSTISSARLVGWSTAEAMEFSFLLALPAILGATTLELINFSKQPYMDIQIDPLQYFIGFLSSFIFGIIALKLLRYIAIRNNFIYFVWYCGLLGIFTLLLFN